MITVACLTSLVALNGKNQHAGTGIPQLLAVWRTVHAAVGTCAQNDAFGHPYTLHPTSPYDDAEHTVSYFTVQVATSFAREKSPFCTYYLPSDSHVSGNVAPTKHPRGRRMCARVWPVRASCESLEARLRPNAKLQPDGATPSHATALLRASPVTCRDNWQP